MLTGHASRSNPNGSRGKRGWKKGQPIRDIPSDLHMEKAFDRSAEAAVDAFLSVLSEELLAQPQLEGLDTPESNSHDVEFD